MHMLSTNGPDYLFVNTQYISAWDLSFVFSGWMKI